MKGYKTSLLYHTIFKPTKIQQNIILEKNGKILKFFEGLEWGNIFINNDRTLQKLFHKRKNRPEDS